MSGACVIVVPALNEAGFIRDCLISLARAAKGVPIWVFDGGSWDGTRSIVHELTAEIPGLRLFPNPGKIQAEAINKAAERAYGQGIETLVRADAHAVYPAHFVTHLLTVKKATGAASVVVPMISKGQGGWLAAAADLYNSPLGHGGAGHRKPAKSGFVEHGHHAALDLAAFLSLGGYDPAFPANEDAEFDVRLRNAGYEIYQASDAAITYFPRATPTSTARQMLRNGWFRASNLALHGTLPKLRQVFPVLIALLSICAIGAALSGVEMLLVVPLSYVATVAIAACHAASQKRLGRVLRILWLAVLSHHSFGLGMIASAIAIAGSRAGLTLRRREPCRS